MIALIAIDQWTKVWAITHLKGQPPEIYLGDFFRFDYAENSGAFLSLGASLSAETRFWIFTVLVSLFLVIPFYYLFKKKYPHWAQPLALAAIIAGGIGNLIDRAFRPNHVVVDFMNMGIGPLRTGIFNVADMAILFGVIVLFYFENKLSSTSSKK